MMMENKCRSLMSELMTPTVQKVNDLEETLTTSRTEQMRLDKRISDLEFFVKRNQDRLTAVEKLKPELVEFTMEREQIEEGMHTRIDTLDKIIRQSVSVVEDFRTRIIQSESEMLRFKENIEFHNQKLLNAKDRVNLQFESFRDEVNKNFLHLDQSFKRLLVDIEESNAKVAHINDTALPKVELESSYVAKTVEILKKNLENADLVTPDDLQDLKINVKMDVADSLNKFNNQFRVLEQIQDYITGYLQAQVILNVGDLVYNVIDRKNRNKMLKIQQLKIQELSSNHLGDINSVLEACRSSIEQIVSRQIEETAEIEEPKKKKGRDSRTHNRSRNRNSKQKDYRSNDPSPSPKRSRSKHKKEEVPVIHEEDQQVTQVDPEITRKMTQELNAKENNRISKKRSKGKLERNAERRNERTGKNIEDALENVHKENTEVNNEISPRRDIENQELAKEDSEIAQQMTKDEEEIEHNSQEYQKKDMEQDEVMREEDSQPRISNEGRKYQEQVSSEHKMESEPVEKISEPELEKVNPEVQEMTISKHGSDIETNKMVHSIGEVFERELKEELKEQKTELKVEDSGLNREIELENSLSKEDFNLSNSENLEEKIELPIISNESYVNISETQLKDDAYEEIGNADVQEIEENQNFIEENEVSIVKQETGLAEEAKEESITLIEDDKSHKSQAESKISGKDKTEQEQTAEHEIVPKEENEKIRESENSLGEENNLEKQTKLEETKSIGKDESSEKIKTEEFERTKTIGKDESSEMIKTEEFERTKSIGKDESSEKIRTEELEIDIGKKESSVQEDTPEEENIQDIKDLEEKEPAEIKHLNDEINEFEKQNPGEMEDEASKSDNENKRKSIVEQQEHQEHENLISEPANQDTISDIKATESQTLTDKKFDESSNAANASKQDSDKIAEKDIHKIKNTEVEKPAKEENKTDRPIVHESVHPDMKINEAISIENKSEPISKPKQNELELKVPEEDKTIEKIKPEESVENTKQLKEDHVTQIEVKEPKNKTEDPLKTESMELLIKENEEAKKERIKLSSKKSSRKPSPNLQNRIFKEVPKDKNLQETGKGPKEEASLEKKIDSKHEPQTRIKLAEKSVFASKIENPIRKQTQEKPPLIPNENTSKDSKSRRSSDLKQYPEVKNSKTSESNKAKIQSEYLDKIKKQSADMRTIEKPEEIKNPSSSENKAQNTKTKETAAVQPEIPAQKQQKKELESSDQMVLQKPETPRQPISQRLDKSNKIIPQKTEPEKQSSSSKTPESISKIPEDAQSLPRSSRESEKSLPPSNTSQINAKRQDIPAASQEQARSQKPKTEDVEVPYVELVKPSAAPQKPIARSPLVASSISRSAAPSSDVRVTISPQNYNVSSSESSEEEEDSASGFDDEDLEELRKELTEKIQELENKHIGMSETLSEVLPVKDELKNLKAVEIPNLISNMESYQKESSTNISLINYEFTRFIRSRKSHSSDVQLAITNMKTLLMEKLDTVQTLEAQVASLISQVDSLTEFSKGLIGLLDQDEDDKQGIQLTGYADGKQQQKRTISFKPDCLSCTGQNPAVLSAFKIACLNYMPTPILFKNHSYSRRDFISFLGSFVGLARQPPSHYDSCVLPNAQESLRLKHKPTRSQVLELPSLNTSKVQLEFNDSSLTSRREYNRLHKNH